jgi:hypothetical protein
MGINDLQFSSSQLAALYPDTLIGGSTYPFLGENRRSICVLVNCEKEEFLPAGELSFLSKILAACQCSLEDIALINTRNNPAEINRLRAELDPELIILWGKNQNLEGLPPDLQEMTPATWERIKILRVSDIELMTGDDPQGILLKKNLWIALKNIFNL